MTKYLLASIFFCSALVSHSQQTVGLFTNTEEAFDGYTLFAPMSSTTTYLIDNCGEKVHSWPSDYRPGLAVYLLENGNLLRTGNAGNSTFTAGGTGGVIEVIDWEGNVLWSYTISSTTECQHHDVAYLPNGNILAIVWDAYTTAEAVDAGRTSSGAALWSEKVVEIEPDYNTGEGTIVWEWKAWDHLVQDENASQNNFGIVADLPGRIDVNFVQGAPTKSDWLHINSVDYNEQLDQIVLSNHNFSEVWIIDHSTSMAEASGQTGGNSGKGGDLLYRWGNPQAYGQGTANDQRCFLQHNAYWIDDNATDAGMLMVFNNQTGTNFSTVDVIDPPVDAKGNYSYTSGAYAPSDFHWTYKAANESDFYATNISGSQRLSNGNTLICEGPSGRFFEVDYDGTTVWEYVSPVAGASVLAQGDAAAKNTVFRAERYEMSYSGLEGKTLVPQGYIETGSTFSCKLYSGVADLKAQEPLLYPNPASETLLIDGTTDYQAIEVVNSRGQKQLSVLPINGQVRINVSNWTPGIYFLQAYSENNGAWTQTIVIE